MDLFKFKSKTFAGKLTWILCCASMLVFCIIYTLAVWNVAVAIPKYEAQTNVIKAKYFMSKIQNAMSLTEKLVVSQERLFRESISDKEKMEVVLRDFFVDQRICESFICVRPGYAGWGNKGVMVDVIRDTDGVPVTRVRDASYDFTQHAYYNIPFTDENDYWNEPYYVQGVPIMTFSHPLKDENGEVIAVYGLDLNLQMMADTLMAANERNHGELLIKLLSRNGRYIVHEDRSMIAKHTFLDEANAYKNDDYEKACINMLSGEDSTLVLNYNGGKQLMTYMSIPHLGWGVILHKPYKYLYRDLIRGIIVTFIIMLFGLAIMVPTIRYVVHHMTMNITTYAKAAENIAKGDFNTPVEHTHTNDEIQKLGDALDNMRISLNDYMLQIERTTAERKSIERDLHIANSIQMSMLPHVFPTPPDSPAIDVHAYLQPAKEVGGDLYDFLLRDHKFHFIVGDVSGKGVPASLIMAITSSLFRALMRNSTTVQGVVQGINNAISESNERNMFVTLIVGELDLDTGHLEFCNAGHNPMLRVDGSNPRPVNMEQNLPVGLMHDWQFVPNSIDLQPNETLLLYTDGVVEAENTQQELFGMDRLLQATATSGGNTSRDMVNHIKHQLENFSKDAEQSDDMTIMSMCYKPITA